MPKQLSQTRPKSDKILSKPDPKLHLDSFFKPKPDYSLTIFFTISPPSVIGDKINYKKQTFFFLIISFAFAVGFQQTVATFALNIRGMCAKHAMWELKTDPTPLGLIKFRQRSQALLGYMILPEQWEKGPGHRWKISTSWWCPQFHWYQWNSEEAGRS